MAWLKPGAETMAILDLFENSEITALLESLSIHNIQLAPG